MNGGWNWVGMAVLLAVAIFVNIVAFVIVITWDLFLDMVENHEFYAIAKAEGWSMYPTIKNGDFLVIWSKGHPNFNLTEGDIAVYYRDDMLIAHRVIDVITINGKLYYITQGDNNQIEDQPVPYENICGEVVKIIHSPAEAWCYEASLNMCDIWLG